MDETNIEVRIAAPNVAVVTLDRPPVNALDRATREAMLRVFDRLEANDEVNAIVFTARGRVFCAGADIKEKQALAGEEAANYVRANRLTRDAFFCILDSSKPVIAAGARRGAWRRLRPGGLLRHYLRRRYGGVRLPEIDVGQGGGAAFLQRILPPSKAAADDADRRARPGRRNSIGSARSKLACPSETCCPPLWRWPPRSPPKSCRAAAYPRRLFDRGGARPA